MKILPANKSVEFDISFDYFDKLNEEGIIRY